jgi:hypothetical protein
MPPIAPRLASRLPQLQSQPPHALEALARPWIALPARLRGAQRERIYPLRQVFWIFLAQVLAADKSCARAVCAHLAALSGQARFMPSPDTAAYCRARARLALRDLRAVWRSLLAGLKNAPAPRHLWCGRPVKVVDGSSLSMPDTPANQRPWPQPRGQKPGCGFPVLRLVVLFSLTSGAALAWAGDALHVDERSLWRRLWRYLEPGDIVLADRGFCDLAGFWLLGQRAIDCVMRLHQRRKSGVRPLRRLGRRDWLVEWVKTKVRPQWLTAQRYEQLPAVLLVRHVSFTVPVAGWRSRKITVATTLLNPKLWPARALRELYLRRWRCELYLRDIKTTLGMDVLRCKTPAMIRKEILMFMIAHNLLRALIAQAACRHGVAPEELGFKGAVAALEAFAARAAQSGAAALAPALLLAPLLQCIARQRLPCRPHRVEPRAKKRRPKNYPLLNQPRHQYHEIPHRNRYSIA